MTSVQPPPGAVLARVFAHGTAWPASLPAVPAPHEVTVTLSDPRLATDLATPRGYRVVGVAGGPRRLEAGCTVDLLITPALRRDAPAWWAQVAEQSLRLFDLDLGPVRTVLSHHVALHLGA